MGVVCAGNSSDHQYIPNTYYSNLENVEVVYADANGHFNIPFSDGSYGYCLEYMEEEAVKGDVFIVANTSFAVNNRTGEDVSNLLKVYFIDYEGYKDNPVVAQHMIWHFTDDFDGWRVNKTLVNNIKETSEYKKLPDSNVIRYNSTHNLGYKFNSFLSPYSHHQNYWGYDIWFELIKNCCNDNFVNNTYNNITNNNITENYINITHVNVTNNYTNITNNNTTLENITVNNYTNNTNIVINNNTTIINVKNITNISQDTYINNTTNNINNQYINQTNNTLIENNTYNNNTSNNYTWIINNQNNTPVNTIYYYIIYIIKQNPTTMHQLTSTPTITYQPILLSQYQTAHEIIGIGTLLIILIGGILYTILREH